MQIILLEKIANVGDLGDVVKVREGYARNYLLIDGKWQDHLLFATLREDWRR